MTPTMSPTMTPTMTPAEQLEQFTTIKRALEVKTGIELAGIERREKERQKFLAMLQTATDDYIQTGIAVISVDLYNWWDRWCPDRTRPHGYFRELATFYKRPFCCASPVKSRYFWFGTWWGLTIQRSERMDKLATALILPSEPTGSFDTYNPRVTGLKPQTIYRSSNASTWKFYFHCQHLAPMYGFIEHCKTDPVARILLKV